MTYCQRLLFLVKAGEQLAAIRHDAGQEDASLEVAAVPNSGFQGSKWTGAGMQAAPSEMLRVLGRTEYLVLDTACHKVALGALKLHERGRLTDAGLRLALATTRRVRQLMPKAALYWFPLPRPLCALTDDSADHVLELRNDRLYAEQHLEQQRLSMLLLNNESVEGATGGIETGEFPKEIDVFGVMRRVKGAKTLQEVVSVLLMLKGLIYTIRERFDGEGEMLLGRLHVQGLLHSVFLTDDGFCIPSPCAAMGEADEDSGAEILRGSPSGKDVTEIVAVLLDLACELAAASKSLPPNRESEALDKIVMGVLVIFMDAVLMVELDEDEGPLTVFEDSYQGMALLSRSGGGLSFADVTANAPISSPGALRVRAEVQAYFDAAESRADSHFLHFKVTDDGDRTHCFYVKDDQGVLSPTVAIFRDVARALGYNPATTKDEAPEIEKCEKGVPAKVDGIALEQDDKGQTTWPETVLHWQTEKNDPGEKYLPDHVTVNGIAVSLERRGGRDMGVEEMSLRRMSVCIEQRESITALYCRVPI